MSALLRLLFAVLVAGFFISGIFFFLASLLNNLAFNPESRAWKEMIGKLRARLNPKIPNRKSKLPEVLTPFDSETLAHLSLKPTILKKAGWRDTTIEGVISTIYQEPVLVFAGQKNGKNGAFVAKTSDKEYIFTQKGKETNVWLDGKPYAVFVDGTLLSTGKQSKMLAKIEPDPELRQWPVLIGSAEGATLTNAERAVSPIPRAVTLLRNLNPEEEQALLVLSAIQVLK